MEFFLKKIYKNKGGQSIIELVIALAIFSLLATAFISLALSSISLLDRSGQIVTAEGYVQAGSEAVRSIKARAWNEIIYDQSSLSEENGIWKLAGEGIIETLGSYTRSFDFYPVFRNSLGGPVSGASPDAVLDIFTKDFKTTITWEVASGATTSIERYQRISATNAGKWDQNSWLNGNGQEIWLASDKYFYDDGNIAEDSEGRTILKEIATSTYALTGYLESSAFDIGHVGSFIALSWDADFPQDCPECTVRLQIKTARDDNGVPGPWSSTWCGPEGDDGSGNEFFTVSSGQLINAGSHNRRQWIKYKAVLNGNEIATPVLKSVKIYYQ
jgi:type II secretory pathway pseudopilin PulG